jgi:hypothetical protein
VPKPLPFSEDDLRLAIAEGACWADAMRRLGYSPKGSNYQTVKGWAHRWDIATDHFDPNVGRRRASRRRAKPLEEALVENSSYHRGNLKKRLLATGIKQPVCEMCGQGEMWRGERMSLVLDHINGVSNDHRLGNLRIVCPNCAATLATHCGRNLPRERVCPGCNRSFAPRQIRHRYCSQKCWGKVYSQRIRGVPKPEKRKVERPSYEQLKVDLAAMSVCAVGRKYGVSDNAVRKWVRSYQRARDPDGGADP